MSSERLLCRVFGHSYPKDTHALLTWGRCSRCGRLLPALRSWEAYR